MTALLSRPSSLPTPASDARSRPRATAHAWVVLAAGAVGLVVTLGMWVRHGQLGAAEGPGGALTAGGQLAALVGTYAVLAQLLLMSRIAWLERAIGLDRLAVWHRWTGFATLWLLATHVVLSTLGWAQGAIPPVTAWHETAWLVAHEPDILMAWAGFALLIAVAVTSVRVARRRLKRETWYFVHLYAYLAVALSFAHQLAVGSDFDADPAARVWWLALYAIVFGSILWWRVIDPLRLNVRHGFRVHAVTPEAPDVVSIVLSGRRLDRLDAQPGQFFFWRFLTPTGWWQAHPFSLSAAPRSNRVRITVKSLGDYTSRLSQLRRGTRVLAEGPYGTFTAERRTRRGVLLIAGGIGITPLRALLDTFGPHDDVVLLYRVVDATDVVFADELRRFADGDNVRVHVITGAEIGDDETDSLGIAALRRGVPDIAERDCFVCGPPGLIEAVCRRLRLLHVPQAHIHYERFDF